MAEEETESVDESFEELAKKAETAEDDDDDDVVVVDRGDDKAEALIEKVEPIQANEFTCKSCFLVKHRSQLADKRKGFCLDCV